MSATGANGEGRGEILRQASVALGGRPVTLWEVAGHGQLAQQATSDPAQSSPASALDLYSTLERWNIPIARGSRWVGCRAWREGPWVVAPVRTRPPAPPPGGRERRSRERLTLELAGLCIGLVDGREGPGPQAAPAVQADPIRELPSLPAMIVHEASNPLTAARAGLQLAMESIGRWTEVAAERRLDILDELGLVVDDIDRALQFLRAVQDRARGAVARSERFDAVRVVRSCITLESRLLRERGLSVEFIPSVEVVYLRGDPNGLFDVLVNLLRNAGDASAAGSDPIEVRLDVQGGAFRLTVHDHGAGVPAEHLDRLFDPGFTTKEFGKGSGMGLAVVQSVVEDRFGGTVTVDSAPGRGTTFTVRLPMPPQRSGQPSAVGEQQKPHP